MTIASGLDIADGGTVILGALGPAPASAESGEIFPDFGAAPMWDDSQLSTNGTLRVVPEPQVVPEASRLGTGAGDAAATRCALRVV